MAEIIRKISGLFIQNNRLQRIWILAKTDFIQRYYGSILGLAWAFINPFFRLIVYYFAFSYLIFRGSDPDFVLYLFSGIITWQFFSESTKKGMNLLSSKRYLIQNIRINKLDIFYASIISILFGFAFNLISFFIISLFFDISYSANLLYVPLLIFNLCVLSLGITAILSTVSIYFRDLDHVWDMVLLVGFWTVPIIWDYQFIFTDYLFMLYLTPVTGILIGLRDALIYDSTPDIYIVLYDFGYSFVVLILGLILLKKYSHKAAEIL